MSIGFCVDYTVHVLHFAAPASDPMPAKIERSIKAVGYDVFHGCATAFLGVFMLSFAGSMAFRTFAAMAMVITSVGGIFALAGLPSVLLLVSRAWYGDQAEDQQRGQAEAEASNPFRSNDDDGAAKASAVMPVALA